VHNHSSQVHINLMSALYLLWSGTKSSSEVLMPVREVCAKCGGVRMTVSTLIWNTAKYLGTLHNKQHC